MIDKIHTLYWSHIVDPIESFSFLFGATYMIESCHCVGCRSKFIQRLAKIIKPYHYKYKNGKVQLDEDGNKVYLMPEEKVWWVRLMDRVCQVFIDRFLMLINKAFIATGRVKLPSEE